MTNEEKQLLLKDLCARLPYGVIIHNEDGYEGQLNSINNIPFNIKLGVNITVIHRVGFRIDTCKPYLRPMSSMTEEEMKELSNYENSVQRTDFFYSHYIDCRFMIEKGLALEAPEGMYKTE